MVRDIMTMRLIIRHPLPPNQQLVYFMVNLLSTAVPAMVRDIMTMRLIIRHPLPPNQQIDFLFYAKPVEYGGASNGEGHHDDEVGEEGERAENQVWHLPKSRLDNLYTMYCADYLTRIASSESIWGSSSKKGRLLKNQ
jgi:hypothetical protein